MKRITTALLGALLFTGITGITGVSGLAVAQSGPDCRKIAAATVAELRAGYAEWDEAAEQVARAAAGAACVKASAAAATATASISSTPVSSGSAEAVAATGESAVEGRAAETSESAAAEKPAVEEEPWTPFSDLKFNKVSASPSKKPYQRRRDADNDED